MSINDEYQINTGTGSHGTTGTFKIVDLPFGQYNVKMMLTESNKFVNIVEIAKNKDFMNHEQKILSAGFHDVENLYK